MLRLPSSVLRPKAPPEPKKLSLSQRLQSLCSFCCTARDDGGDEGPAPPLFRAPSANEVVNRRNLILQHDENDKLEEFYSVEKESIGEGGFGTVRKAKLLGTDLVRVVKAVDRKVSNAVDRAQREIGILLELDHPSICRLHETFQDHRFIYLILEYVEGCELFDEIVKQGRLDEECAVSIMSQLFSALAYCHRQLVMHRDLKPENIMVQGQDARRDKIYPIKVIDFGLAVLCMPGQIQKSVVGTSTYVAPEVMVGSYGLAADIWSAGIVFHTLLSGLPPKKEEGSNREIVNVESMSGGVWQGISEGSKALVWHSLRFDAAKRITAQKGLHECLILEEHFSSRGRLPSPSLGAAVPSKEMKGTMKQFMAFQQSNKLRRAVLTAIAMQLTDSSLQDLKDQFAAIDKDHDGTISYEEFEECMAREMNLNPKLNIRTFAASIFQAADTDGSGSMDYSEFLAAALREQTYCCEEAIRAAFRVFDQDGNGQISREEVASVIANSGDEVESLMSEVDLNGDGLISYEEFRVMVCPKNAKSFS